ncbi:MAG TPA: hypothetical protein VF553_15040 [Pyrinomonadaceae bacterium]|jgi:hypothetical protein
MTSILSTISGYFSKSLILGVFLPAVIFIILGWLFLLPLLPSGWTVFKSLEGLDKQWQVAATLFIAIVMSGLLYNLNIPILRLYEGYPWRDSLIGSWLTRRQMAKFDAAQHQLAAMRAVLREMEAADKDFARRENYVTEAIENWKGFGAPLRAPGFKERQWLRLWETAPGRPATSETQQQWQQIFEEVLTEYSSYRGYVKREFPESRSLILPTRLGNIVRSFEYYPKREYGIDSIEIWPRLIAAIPSDFAVSIDDAKTAFDFMMNCSALSGAMSAALLLAGLINPAALSSPGGLAPWAIEILAFGFLAYCFYRLSIPRADAWGSMVKSSFDLYRRKLLEQLGYKYSIEARKDERTLWEEISRQMIFGDPLAKASPLDYTPPSPASLPSVRSAAPSVKFELARGVKLQDAADSGMKIFVRVKNLDPHLAAANVIVTDKLPDDFDYEWESARVDGAQQPIPVVGSNPYQFHIGHLLPNQSVLLNYRCVLRQERGRQNLIFSMPDGGRAWPPGINFNVTQQR